MFFSSWSWGGVESDWDKVDICRLLKCRLIVRAIDREPGACFIPNNLMTNLYLTLHIFNFGVTNREIKHHSFSFIMDLLVVDEMLLLFHLIYIKSGQCMDGWLSFAEANPFSGMSCEIFMKCVKTWKINGVIKNLSARLSSKSNYFLMILFINVYSSEMKDCFFHNMRYSHCSMT